MIVYYKQSSQDGGLGPLRYATGYLKACIETVISSGIELEHFCQVVYPIILNKVQYFKLFTVPGNSRHILLWPDSKPSKPCIYSRGKKSVNKRLLIPPHSSMPRNTSP